MKRIRLAVISDLHYRRHNLGQPCRPAASLGGPHADPMPRLIEYLQNHISDFARDDGSIADYLLCPGDITDRADKSAFDEGWNQLKNLKTVLGARHLITTTGNHEVDSRAGEEHDHPGNSLLEVDPLATLQKHQDYPSTALSQDKRWVYWGRGYEFIEEEDVIFLLLNSSHYHATTRVNEFQRGRIGDVALENLREDLPRTLKNTTNKLLVALLHHHPIPHQHLSVDLDKVEMDNGARLMEALSEQQQAWLVIHGHKHHPRLLVSQTESVVFAAGSFGAALDGVLADITKLQFYIVECDVLDQHITPRISGHIRALSWAGLEWKPAQTHKDGLPDGCGFSLPQVDLIALAAKIKFVLEENPPFMSWEDLVTAIPDLHNILPEKYTQLKRALEASGIKTTWEQDHFFPEDAAI